MLPLYHISQLILFGSNDSYWLVSQDLRMWKRLLATMWCTVKRNRNYFQSGLFSSWAPIPVPNGINFFLHWTFSIWSLKESKWASRAAKPVIFFCVAKREWRGLWTPPRNAGLLYCLYLFLFKLYKVRRKSLQFPVEELVFAHYANVTHHTELLL